MARHMRYAEETSEGMRNATTGRPDVAAALALTSYPFKAEGAPRGTRTPIRGDSTRMVQGTGVSAPDFAPWIDHAGNEHPALSGEVPFVIQVTQPGAANTHAHWTLLNSAYDIDTPARAADTVTGVSALRLTPANPADWETGDIAAVTIDGAVYGFRVTGRNGNDIIISPGLPSTLGSNVSVRLYHRLYMKPRGEGSSFAIFEHNDDTLWIGLGCRLGSHTFRRGGDGRLLIEGTVIVPLWVASHSNANPYQGSSVLGDPAYFVNTKFNVTDEYQGRDGTLTTAPQSADRLTGLSLRDITIAVERGTQVKPGIHDPAYVCRTELGQHTVNVTAGFCDYSGTFNGDPNKNAIRHMSVATSNNADDLGVVFWMVSKINSVPDDMKEDEVRDYQEIGWQCAADAEPVDTAPGTGSAGADVNCAGFFLGLAQ